MAKAKDIMTDNVVSVKKDSTMFEAAQLLSLNDITGLPVVDDEMNLVGIITEIDVLEMFDVMQYKEDRKVISSMSQDVVHFDIDENIDEILRCFRNEIFRRVPVTKEGKVVGIISRRDLILYMLKQRRKNEENSY